jgi:hypothetical protein
MYLVSQWGHRREIFHIFFGILGDEISVKFLYIQYEYISEISLGKRKNEGIPPFMWEFSIFSDIIIFWLCACWYLTGVPAGCPLTPTTSGVHPTPSQLGGGGGARPDNRGV